VVNQHAAGYVHLAEDKGDHRTLFHRIAAEDRQQVLWRNAAALYRL